MTKVRKLLKAYDQGVKEHEGKPSQFLLTVLDVQECKEVSALHGKETLKRMLLERYEAALNDVVF